MAYALTRAFLALVLDPSVRTRSTFRVALHATKLVFAVHANGAAAAWLAFSANTTVFANASSSTIFALVFVLTVTTDGLSSTVLASAPHSMVPANGTATALGASAANPTVLA